MSKKRSKKPSKQIKEAQEDFWDLGDDDLELTLEGSTAKKEPEPDKKEKPSSKKTAASKKSSSKEKKPEKEETKDSEKKSTKPATSKKPSSKKKESHKKETEETVSKSEKEPRKSTSSKTTESKSTKATSSKKISDIEDDIQDLEIEEFDIEDQSPPEPEYKSAESAKIETKLVRKKEETGSRFIKKETTPTTLVEKISLFILLACLFGALAWGISTFLSEAPQGEVVTFKEDYPAKGQNITVASVETWWKKPIRKGEHADVGIVLEANLVPCAKITLSDGGSTTLRVSFRNGEKELIGDTINLTVQDGKFARSGSNTVEIYATSGFENASNINAYANGDINPWSLIINEGNEDEALVKARISADSNTP